MKYNMDNRHDVEELVALRERKMHDALNARTEARQALKDAQVEFELALNDYHDAMWALDLLGKEQS